MTYAPTVPRVPDAGGGGGGAGCANPVVIAAGESFVFEHDGGADLFVMDADAVTPDDDSVGYFTAPGLVRSDRPTVATATTAGEAITATNLMRGALINLGVVV